MTSKHWVIVAASMGFVAVLMGAFASHGLKDQMSDQALAWIEIAAKYQMYHALSLLGLACLSLKLGNSTAARVSGVSFIIGIVCFSGSLYWLAFDGPKILVYITPIGGVLLAIGWLALFFVAVKIECPSVK